MLVAPQQFVRARIERWLEAERDQLALWLPVMLGLGIATWFVLPDEARWIGAIALFVAIALVGLAVGRGGRFGRVLLVGALSAALGLALIWWRAERVAAPVLARPAVAVFTARIDRVEPLPARDLVRLTLIPASSFPRRRESIRAGAGKTHASQRQWIPAFAGMTADRTSDSALPPKVRVNLAQTDAPAGLARGAVIKLRARLMPPAPPAVPGAYDFERVAWFAGLGASGRAFAPVEIVTAAAAPGADLRSRLSRHIQSNLDGSEGGIASALATGDQGAVSEEDAEAMRRSGLAHLLSVSGLHITAVVAGTMFVMLRLLALSPWLARRFRLPLFAAGAGALAAVGYTLLTGSEVPTIRSCVAALLVLAALALGREAITLRLVAAGATIVLLLWPESLAGPSFQLSFAAVAAIVALHEHPRVRGWFRADGASLPVRAARELASLLLTGFAVEIALAPIALYHFHKAGLYGALANIVAIPLTTFVIMPLEALALLFDLAGLGAPFWWLCGQGLALLLWIARTTAAVPGSVAALPAMPDGAYALMIAGGLWIALWRTRWRRLGMLPLAAGAIWALATPAPDLLVTGDGRHVAVRTPGGGIALLRERAGDYTRTMLTENGGVDGEPLLLEDQPGATCSKDLCVATVAGKSILATRSAYLVPVREMIAACRRADIVISERRLPRGCDPKWLRLDRQLLARTGGIAVSLSTGRIVSVRTPGDRHPWRHPETVIPPSVSRSRQAGAAAVSATGSPAGS